MLKQILTACVVFASYTSPASAETRPNILFIVCDDLSTHVSISGYPTLAELCGLTPLSELQGRSLVGMLKDPRTAGKEVAYTVVTRGKALGKAVRTQRYRYTWWLTGEELYDLSADPNEQANLAVVSGHEGTLEAMRKHLAAAEMRAVARRQ